jgi:hypothetical protein
LNRGKPFVQEQSPHHLEVTEEGGRASGHDPSRVGATSDALNGHAGTNLTEGMDSKIGAP